MAKQKYKLRKKAETKVEPTAKKRPKSRFSAKQRMTMLIIWGAVCAGLYAAVSKVMFLMSFRIFVIIFVVAAILYFITGVKLGKLMNDGREDSEEFEKLADRGKLLLIVMIPPLFVMIYDFVSSTIKMFM